MREWNSAPGQPESKPPDDKRSVTRESLRIVLVENDPDDLFFLQRALTQRGFVNPLVHLWDGRDAIDYLAALPAQPSGLPDIVLTDLKMPRMDGLDFVRWLREDSALKDLPVIILTSSSDPSDIRRTGPLGVYKFVTKQVHQDNVISALEAFIGCRNRA